MAAGFALYKTMARQAVHDMLAVPCVYLDRQGGILADGLTVRHHTRIATIAPGVDDYAGIIEGINRLVFDRTQLVGITLVRGNLIQIPDYGITLELDQREPDDGPVNAYWSVVEPQS